MDQMDSLTNALSSLSLPSSSSSSTLPTSKSNRKISWPDTLSKKQRFSLPDSIIFYITKNPKSPAVYLKLTKSCKYFFEKLPLLIVSRIVNGRKFCSSYQESGCKKKNQKCCVNVDFTKLTAKIWLRNELYIDENVILNIASNVLPMLYQWKYVYLSLRGWKLKWDEYKSLATTSERCRFARFKMDDNDGKPVMLEKTLEAIPDVTVFD